MTNKSAPKVSCNSHDKDTKKTWKIKIGLKEIEEDSHKNERALNNKNNPNNLFDVKTGNEWLEDAKNRPIPKMLFDTFWFENELCILFADTNLGKSILAVQIANSISSGKAVPGFRMEAKMQKVLYFDFELSDKQFEVRYSENYTNHYEFDTNNFYRAEMNPDAEPPSMFKDFESYLNHSLEESIIRTSAKIIIIDNITYLKNATETAKDAMPLMKHLKALKSKYNLSILALAHTPKRDLSKPITRNDLQGSKMLINFCDSAFSIGESANYKEIRYIKQIKVRNAELLFDINNVATCEIRKQTNFLEFHFTGFGNEIEHLKRHSETDRTELINRVKELSNKGYTQREIANKEGIGLGTVNNYLKM